MLLRRPTEFLHIQYEHSEVIVLPYHKQILTKYIDQLKGKMYLNMLVCFKGIKEIIPPTINNDVHVCLRCNCFLRKLFSHQIFSLQVFRDKSYFVFNFLELLQICNKKFVCTPQPKLLFSVFKFCANYRTGISR